jgi:outer membrane protein assembly factor BamB
MSLTGDVSEIPIGEVIQTLSLNAHEGTLRIYAPTGEKLFYLSKGEAQLIVPGKKATRIGEALVKTHRISAEQLAKALEIHAESGKILGKTLVEMGMVAEADIEAVVRQQFRDEFFEVFLLEKGKFEFLFDVRPENLVTFDESLSRVSLNTSSLMMEALRQIDEWKQMTERIATPRAIFRLAHGVDAEDAIADLDAPEEAKASIQMIDGHRSIEDLVRESGATKFDIYSVVFELLKKGATRPLTHEECRTGAFFAEENGRTYEATVYYEFGLFLAPGDQELLSRQFKLLKRLAVYDEAHAAALALGDANMAADDFEQALAYYLEAQAIDDKDLRAADGVFRAYVKLERTPRTLKAGDDLVQKAMRSHDYGRAREALAIMIPLEPDGHARRVVLGDALAEERNKVEAVRQYELALKGIGEHSSAPEVAEICRKILAVDEKREDMRSLLKMAAATEEKRGERRARRLTLGAVVAFVVAGAGWYGSYEWVARSELAEANALAADDARLRDAADRLRGVAHRFPLSTVAAGAEQQASELVERARRREEDRLRLAATEESRRRDTEQEKRREAAMEILRHGRLMERKGDYRGAADAYFEVARDYADVPLEQRVRIPVPLTSEPSGARVRRGADDLGATPCVVYIDPLKETKLRIECPGFVPAEVALKSERYEEVKLALERAPVWTWKAEAAVDVAPAVFGGRVFVASRSGSLAALDAKTGRELWKARIGEWGDAFSPPGAFAGKVFVGTSEGRVVAIDQGAGRSLFAIDAGGPVRAEPRQGGRDGAIVGVGAASGLALFARAASGERLFALRTDHRIDAPVRFAGDTAYVGSRDGKLYAVALPDGAPRWTFAAGDDLLAGPTVAGDVVAVGTRDGRVIGVLAASGKECWRVETAGRLRAGIVAAAGALLAGSEDGKLYAIDPASGAVRATFDAGVPIVAAPALGEKGLYLAASDGTVFCLDPEKLTTRWRYPLGAACFAAPVFADGRLYLAAADGSVRAILE